MNICIIGGGATGLITAHYLNSLSFVKNITLISPKEIPPIGVGESTTYGFFYFLKNTLKLNEEDIKNFLFNINACYKYGVSYRGWSEKEYLNAFHDGFDYEVKKNIFLLGNKDLGKNVNLYTSPPANFSYKNKVYFDTSKVLFESENINSFHFDANKFIKTMTDLAKKNNIKVLEDSVENVEFLEEKILSLKLKSGEVIKSDYYINCIGNTKVNENIFNITYKKYTDVLLTDTAIAFPLPYKDKEKEMHPFTVAKTMKNGWRWITPTWSRIGTGYVFSQNYISIDQAIDEFRKDIGDQSIEPFAVDFTPKRCQLNFRENWCTLGMAAGFLEPLDAPGLAMTILSLFKLNDLLSNQITKKEANKWYEWLYDHWCSFILHQYKTCSRSDSDFWRDQKSVNFEFYNELINTIFRKGVTLQELEASGYEWNIFYITTSGKDISWKVSDADRPTPVKFNKQENLKNHYLFLKEIYENQEEIQ